MMDMKQGGWIQRRVNGVLHQMLGGGTSEVNDQDQIIQSGNYSYLSIRVASIDEKNSHGKITMAYFWFENFKAVVLGNK